MLVQRCAVRFSSLVERYHDRLIFDRLFSVKCKVEVPLVTRVKTGDVAKEVKFDGSVRQVRIC